MSSDMPKAGRRTKLTPEVAERICAAIAQGNTFVNACRLGDIRTKTFHCWLKRHAGFRSMVTRAKAQAERRAVECWSAAFPQDWRACRDFLARRSPKHWSRTQTQPAAALIPLFDPREQALALREGRLFESHEGNGESPKDP